MPVDTIVYNVQKIAAYQADERYDYSAQVDKTDYNLFDQLQIWFYKLLHSLFGSSVDEGVASWILIGFIALLLAVVVFFIYKRCPELFLRSRKTSAMLYDASGETIHGIDFDAEIAIAVRRGDYRSAARFVYLQTLRFLSDSQLIAWQIHKTPSEYLHEIGNKEMRPYFRDLTNYFLEVRYGNHEASPALFERMQAIQQNIGAIMNG